MPGATAPRVYAPRQRALAGADAAAPSPDQGAYGAVKLWRALRPRAFDVGATAWRGCGRSHGLRSAPHRRFRVIVEHHQFAPPAPNRLQQGFVAPAPNRIWVGDLTAIRRARAGSIWR